MNTFLAYRHEPDSRHAAIKLASMLKRDGVPVWFDQWNIEPGAERAPAVHAALENADVVLAVIGKSEQADDPALERELKQALNQGKTVIPVLSENANFTDIPEIVRDRQAVAALGDRVAYRRLLKALGIVKRDPDDLDDLSFFNRLRSYVING